jgi:hypothetical protein
MDTAAVERMRRASLSQRDHFLEIPALIVPCYDLSEQRKASRRRPGRLTSALAPLGWRDWRPAPLTGGSGARSRGDPDNDPLAFEAESGGRSGFPASADLRDHPGRLTLGPFGPVRRRPASEAIHREAW